jgi:hypothetical protein
MGKSPKISNWVYPKTRDTTFFEREHDKPLDLRMHCFQTRPHHYEAFLVYVFFLMGAQKFMSILQYMLKD